MSNFVKTMIMMLMIGGVTTGWLLVGPLTERKSYFEYEGAPTWEMDGRPGRLRYLRSSCDDDGDDEGDGVGDDDNLRYSLIIPTSGQIMELTLLVGVSL